MQEPKRLDPSTLLGEAVEANDDKSIHLAVSPREFGSILAGLRLLQGAFSRLEVEEATTNGYVFTALSEDEIGELCERLNLD